MFSFNMVRWFEKLLRQRAKGRTIERRRSARRRRLFVEELESRITPAFVWQGDVSNLWSVGGNWAGGVAPAATDNPIDVTFDNTATTLTPINDVSGLIVNQFTVASGNYAFSAAAGGSITLGNASTNTGLFLVNTGASASIAASMGIRLGAPAQSNEFFNVQLGASLTINSALTGNSAAQLTKQGAGTLILSADNSGFLGPFKIDSSVGNGTVQITHAKALGASVTSEVQMITLSSATPGVTQFTLTYPVGANPTTPNLTFTNTAADAINIRNALTTIFGAGTVTVTQSSASASGATFSVVFSGSMANLNVTQLQANITAAPGNISVFTPLTAEGGAPNKTTIDTSAQLQISLAAGGTISNPLVLNGAGPAGTTGAILNVAGNNTLSGTLEMSSANGTSSTMIDVAAFANSLKITGQISNASVSGYTLVKEGLGTLWLDPFNAAGNTYSGNTIINEGMVQISHPFALGPGGGAAIVNSTVNKSGSLGVLFDAANTFVPAQYQKVAQVQTVTLTGAVSGTTQFTLTYNGVTTSPITYGAAIAANVAAALNAVGMTTINGIGASVAVTQSGTTFNITFGGSLGGMDIPTLDADILPNLPGTIAVGTTAGTTPIGFSVPNQFLTLNGPGRAGVTVQPRLGFQSTPSAAPEVTGALNNMGGHNSWEQNITLWSTPTSPVDLSGWLYPSVSLGAVANTNLTINGVITDNDVWFTTLYSFTKVGYGRVILTRANTMPLYQDILQGTLNIRDSNALGYNTGNPGNGVETWAGTTLEFQADNIADSDGSAGTYNINFPTFSPIWLNSTGVYSQGALYSLAGSNKVKGEVLLRSASSIGVAPDPDPFNIQNVTANNLSQLTIDGVISDLAGPTGLTKVGYGELVLTNANTYTGPTTGRYPTVTPQTRIMQGWITVQNDNALGDLGQTSQGFLPPVQVDAGASLMLKEDLNGNNILLRYNLFLAGIGINHRFSWLDQMGALVNLSGGNAIEGYITLNGPAGIGVELDGATAPISGASQLSLSPLNTGAMIFDGSSPGQIIKLGSQRLRIEDAGTYTGGLDLRQGVVAVLNDNALGVGTALTPVTTTVNSGTALELGLTLPEGAGGLLRGLQIWNNHLILNGTGNTLFGDAPLQINGGVQGADFAWRGPITLNSNIAIAFKNQLANEALPLITVNNTSLTGGGTYLVHSTTPGSSGISAVQTLTQSGAITGGTFRLTVRDPAGLSATTAPIAWDANLPILIANIQAALDALATTFGGTVGAGIVTVTRNSPVIDVAPNSRFIVTGTIDDLGSNNPGQLVHAYELNGSYADTLGGPSLIPTGGVLGATNFSFNAGGRAAHLGANEGLTLNGALAPGDTDYSIQVTCTINELPPPAPTDYIRLIDWLTATPDDGMYILDDQLSLYPTSVTGPAGVFAAPGPVTFTLIVTRSPSGTMEGYVNGVLQFSALDATNGVVSPTGNLNFFLDDILGVPNEISSGSVDRILIYNRALTSTEVTFVTAGGTLGPTIGTGTPADLTFSGGGELLLAGPNTYRGTTYINEGFVTLANGAGLGAGPTGELQRLTFGPSAAIAAGMVYNVSFNGSPASPDLVFTNTAADATNLLNALNALPTIGGVIGGSVTVTQVGNSFDIRFGGALAGFDQVPIVASYVSGPGALSLSTRTDGQGSTIVKNGAQLQLQGGISVNNEPLQLEGQGNPAEPEVQSVSTGDLAGGFSLTFQNPNTLTTSTSVGLPVGASAIQVQAVLNQMLSIQQGAGSGGGSVTVLSTGGGQYLVTFEGTLFAAGNLPLMTVAPTRVQIVAITGNSGSFTLDFGSGATTVALAPTVRASGGATPASSLENALNNLLANPTQPGGGGGTAMVLATGAANTFFVTFGGTLAGAAVPLLVPGNFLGTTNANVSSVNNAQTFLSRQLQGGSQSNTPVSWFNTGPSPLANGQVFNSASPVREDVTGRVTDVVVDPVDPNVMYISTAGGGAWKTVNATAATPLWTPLFDGVSAREQIVITGKSGTFQVTFTNPVTGVTATTPLLPYNASVVQFTAAMNGLASIGGAGASIVATQKATAGVNEVQELDLFTPGPLLAGNQFNLTFGGFTTTTITYTGTSADEANIAAALNGLNSIGGVGGSVEVFVVSPGIWNIVFEGSLEQMPQAGVVVATIVGGAFGPENATVVTAGAYPFLRYSVAFVGGTMANVPIQPPGSATPSLVATAFGGANIVPPSYVLVNQAVSNNTPIYAGTIAIAPSDPSALYLGTGEGNNVADAFYGTGVYRATEYGQTWDLVVNENGSNPLRGLVITRIVVDPNNSDQIWVATSDRAVNSTAPGGGPFAPGSLAVGIWRYDPTGGPTGGGQWANITADPAFTGTPIANTDANFAWSDLAYDSATSTLIAAGGANGGANAAQNGVYRCTNPSAASVTWSANTFPPPPPGELNGRITLDTADRGTQSVFAFAENRGAATGILVGTWVQESFDDGATWSAASIPFPANFLSSRGFFASAIVEADVPGTHTFYVGGTDAGTGNQFVFKAVYPLPAGPWAITDISALDSANGPKSGIHGMAMDPNDNLIVATDGGVWRWNVGSSTWSNLNGVNLAITQVAGVATNSVDLNNALIGATHVGTSQYSGDHVWEQVETGSGGLVFFDPNNPNVAYHDLSSGANGTLRYSTDGGATWANTGITSSLFFPFAVSSQSPGPNSSVLFVGGNTLRRYVVNYGVTPNTPTVAAPAPAVTNLLLGTNAPAGPFIALAIPGNQGAFQADPDFPTVVDLGANNADGNTVYVTDGVDVFVTKDLGVTWNATSRTPTLAPDTTIVDLAVDPTNRDHVFVVAGGLSGGEGFVGANGQKRIFESFDAGLTWTDISTGLPDMPAWHLAIDSRNGDLYLGTDVGVYQLQGGVITLTNTWQKFGVNLPDVAVTYLDLNQSLNLITAGTYGRGAWQFFLNDTVVNSGALRAASGSDIWNGPIILTGPTTISAQGNQTLNDGVSVAQLTILGNISDLTNGANTLTKVGFGDVVLAGNNTYGGHTFVTEGALVVKGPNALGSSASGTTVQSGAVLELETSLANEPIFLFGNGVQLNGHFTGALQNVNNNNTYNGVLTLMTNATIGVNTSSSLTLLSPGTITDGAATFGLTKEGKGTLVLTTANTYDGGTTVNLGVLNIQNAGALGAAGTTTRVLDGAQLQLQATLGDINMNLQHLVLSGVGISSTGALFNVSGVNTWNGDILLDALPGFTPTTEPPNFVSFGANPGSTINLNGKIDDPFSRNNTASVPGIETENNDTAATANLVTIPANAPINITGAIGSAGDLDYFRFTLTQRSGVFFDIDSRETGLSALLNSQLSLFDATGNILLAQNDDGYDFETSYPAPTQASNASADSALYFDLDPGTYYIQVSSVGGTAGAYQLAVRADTDYSNTVPAFNSNPTATDTLFLDFDGHADTDAWGTYNMPGFDFNGNPGELTPGEKMAIRNIWRVIAEDYSPFDINVSTNYAGSFADGVAFRMAFSSDDGSGVGQPPVLGIALLNSFIAGGGAWKTAWVFQANAGTYGGGTSGLIVATALEEGDTASHEFGHALGLAHYGGTNGSQQAIMWVTGTPLMRHIWQTGLTDSAVLPVVFQDDMAIISGPANTFGYRADDYGDNLAAATALSTAGGGIFTAQGIISQIATDVDYFSFVAAGGSTLLQANVDEYVNDLDATVRVFDAAGVLIASDDPSPSFDASLTLVLAAGATYYVEVGTNGADGEAGQYDLNIGPTGTVFGGAASGSLVFGLTKVGAGQVVLQQDNFYGGVTTVAAGLLTVQDGGALGSPFYGTVVNSGAVLQIDGDPNHTGASIVVDEFVSINGTGVGGAGAIRNISGDNELTGTVTLASSSSIGVDPTTKLTLTGVVQGPTPAPTPPAALTPPSLTKVGAGTLVLANNNTYTGNTIVSAGALNIQTPQALGVNTTEVQSITLTGTGSGATDGFRLVFAGFSGLPTAFINTNVGAAGLAGSIQTQLNLVLANAASPGGGSGTVTVVQRGASSIYDLTFGGSLACVDVPALSASVIAGPIGLGFVTPLQGGVSTTTVQNGAALQTQSIAGFTETSGKPLFVTGNGVDNLGALQNITGNNTWSTTPITLSANASIGSDAGTLFINQQITGPFSVTKFGVGTVQFTGNAANTYTGLTDVHAGTLELNKTPGVDAIARDLQVGDNAPVSQVQTLNLSSFVYGETFTLSYDGSPASAPITYYTNATFEANLIQTALNGLSTIVPGSVTVTPSPGSPGQFLVSLALGGGNPAMTISAFNVSTSATVNAVITTPGATFAPAAAIVRLLSSNQIADVRNVVINNDGLFDLNDQSETVNNFSILGGTATTGAGGGTLTVNNNLTITDGVLNVPGAGLVNVLNSVIMTGGDINLLGATSSLALHPTLARTLSATSDVATGAATISGPGTVNLGTAGTKTFDIGNGPADSDLVINSVIAGSVASPALVKAGGGILELNAANTYTGETRIDFGGLQVDELGRQTLSLTSFTAGTTFNLTYTNGASTGTTGTITFNNDGNDDDNIATALNNLLLSLFFPTGLVNVVATATPTIFDIVFTGAAAAHVVPLTGSIVSGSGTPSAVSVNDIGNVRLNGGWLSGTGTVGAIAMLPTWSVVNPGVNGTTGGTGVLETNGNVTWDGNTTFFVDINNTTGNHPNGAPGPDNDQLRVNGDVTLSDITLGNALLAGNVLGGTVALNDTYTILQATGTITGSLDGIIGATRAAIPQDGTVFLNGQKFTVHYNASSVVLTRAQAVFTSFTFSSSANPSVYGQEVTISAVATPEPGASFVTTNPHITFTLDGANTVTFDLPTTGPGVGQASFDPQSYFSLIWNENTAHTLTATFTDDNTVFATTSALASPASPLPALSTQLIQNVVKNSVSITPSTNPVMTGTAPVYGQDVQLIATIVPTVAANVLNASNPTGVITFVVDPGLPTQVTFTSPIFPVNPAFPPAAVSATALLQGSSLLSPGLHTVNVTYGGDANYAATPGGSPITFTLTIQKDNTNVQFTPAPTPSFLGQNATFNVTVAPAQVGSIGTPFGTLNFNDGAANGPLLGTIPYDGAPATFNTAVLTLGAHTIFATFTPTVADITPILNGGGGFNEAQDITVNNLGGSFTLTFNGQTTGPLPSNATAGAVQTALGALSTIGNGNVTVTFGGSTYHVTFVGALANSDQPLITSLANDYFGNTASTLFTVNKAPTQTTITSFTPASPTYGQQVTFNVKVIENPDIAPSFGTIVGENVRIWKDAVGSGTLLGTRVIDAAGNASVLTAVGALPTGTYPIIAEFVSNASFATSTFTIPAFTVAGAPTTTTVTASPAGNGVFGNTVRLTAQVASTQGTPPTGSHVIFWDGPVGTGVNLNALSGMSGALNATASTFIDVVLPTAGLHTINASYVDDDDAFANFASSTGTLTGGYRVNNAPTTTSLGVDIASGASVYGQPITLTATITSPGGLVTTGAGSTVQFKDGGVNVGSPVNVVVGPGNTRIAQLVVSSGVLASLSAGLPNHNLSAVYTDTADTFFNGAATPGVINNYAVSAVGTQILGVNFTSSAPIVAQGAPGVTFSAKVTTLAPSIASVNAGSVTFWKDAIGAGGTNLGTFAVATTGANTGVATSTAITTLPLGTFNILAIYSNGTSQNFLGGATQSLSQTVLKASTVNAAVIAAPNNYYGLTLNYQVSVTGTGPEIPNGTITITETIGAGTTTWATVAVNPGGPVLVPVTGLSAGTHNLVVNYSGDGTFAAGAKAISQAVVAAPTVATLNNLSTIGFGEHPTFIATITSSIAGVAAPIAGNVIFKDGAIILATVPLAGTNVAQFTTTSFLSVGSHTITATFSNVGNTNYNSSAPATKTQVVTAVGTQTILNSLTPSFYGNAVTFTATILQTGSAPNPTTGTVTFRRKVGTTFVTLGTKTLNGSNVATLTTSATALPVSPASPGYWEITAVYSGAAPTYASSVSAIGQQVVSKAGVNVTVTPSIASGTLTYGKTVTFTAFVAVNTGGSPGTPVGTVSFFGGAVGTTLLKSNVALVAVNATTAKAVYTTTATQLGAMTHIIRAAYNGGTNFAAQDGVLGYDVLPSNTTISLTSSPSYWSVNTLTTFTATVVGASGGAPGVPPGTVTFFVDGAQQFPDVNLSSGKATFTTMFSVQGPHDVSAIYNPGTANFAPDSLDAPVAQDVRQFTSVDFTSVSSLTGVTVTVTVSTPAAGGPPTGTVGLYEAGVLKGTVTLNANGVGTIVLNLPTGNHTITAIYVGDPNFSPATKTKVIAGKLKTRVL